MIPRELEQILISTLTKSDKLILLYGPRQAGKTTILQNLKTYFIKSGQSVLYLNCDLAEDLSVVDTSSLISLKQLLGETEVLLLDETQRLTNPGLTLKIIHDNFPTIKVAATGSSSFNLKNAASDALTGRYLDFTLYPLSFSEVVRYQDFSDNPQLKKQQTDGLLPSFLLYGAYPDVFLQGAPLEKQTLLTKIIESYLFKDILSFHKIRHSEAISSLAQALAYQIGSEVNESELANRLKIDRKTVVNYLDLLEQTFVIVRVRPFSKNPRREIGRNYKVYFLDLGLRNALVGDFNPLGIRSDAGALWENFIIAERIKMSAHRASAFNYNFWRTFGGAEVDWLERRFNQKMSAFEIKYKPGQLSRGAYSFTHRYNIPVKLIDTSNYLEFIS